MPALLICSFISCTKDTKKIGQEALLHVELDEQEYIKVQNEILQPWMSAMKEKDLSQLGRIVHEDAKTKSVSKESFLRKDLLRTLMNILGIQSPSIPRSAKDSSGAIQPYLKNFKEISYIEIYALHYLQSL